MKLTIRFADKIVGVLIVGAVGMLIAVIIMLGSNLRWFSHDYTFFSYFPSATGLSTSMPVQYKGFTIGHVKSIRLSQDDQVEVCFTIFDTYRDRVKYGSLVEVLVSPIGGLGGSQFLFYPGKGTDLLDEDDVIPTVTSSEGKWLLEHGLADLPERDDGINNIMNRIGTILADVQGAIAGSDKTALGQTMLGLQTMSEKLPGDIEDALTRIMEQLEPILVNLKQLTDKAADPDETVMAILDSQGDIYANLVVSLNALSGILNNLEKTSEPLPGQLVQFVTDLQTALDVLQDVLVSVGNNPLLKKGMPAPKEPAAAGAYTRDAEF